RPTGRSLKASLLEFIKTGVYAEHRTVVKTLWANLFAKGQVHSPKMYRLNYRLRGQVRSHKSTIT
ncbi:hypothetical protein, partial [Pseudomonas amygdali]